MENLSNEDISTILVVDDQQNNLSVISSVLTDKYKLYPANSGERALKILEKIRPDLILLDVMMPGMSGFEVCQIIKANESTKHIPIIFLTARTEIDDVVKGFDLGAVDYITKPFNIKELNSRIKTQLDMQQFIKIISKQKYELEKRNEELVALYKTVEEHSHEILQMFNQVSESEEKLIELNKRLNLSNAEKDKFFSIISHDLKSPFGACMGLMQLLNDDYEAMTDDDIKSIILELLKSSRNLYSLLDNLLEWSRFQRNLITPQPVLLQMHPMLSNIISIFELVAKNKNISVEFNVPKDLSFISDQKMLDTILRNLISNAIKYTHNGGKISIVITRTEDKTLEVCVEDTGIGMSQDTMGRIFSLNDKVSQQGTANEKGTGLGLVLSSEFANKLGGKIWVESQEGIGSKFFVSLKSLTLL